MESERRRYCAGGLIVKLVRVRTRQCGSLRYSNYNSAAQGFTFKGLEGAAAELVWRCTKGVFHGRDIFHHSEVQEGKV